MRMMEVWNLLAGSSWSARQREREFREKNWPHAHLLVLRYGFSLERMPRDIDATTAHLLQSPAVRGVTFGHGSVFIDFKPGKKLPAALAQVRQILYEDTRP